MTSLFAYRRYLFKPAKPFCPDKGFAKYGLNYFTLFRNPRQDGNKKDMHIK